MAYSWTLGNGQQIYLDNQGEQTTITSLIASAGQHQQSTNSFTTGKWTSPPEMFIDGNKVVLKLQTESGDVAIAIQGGSMSMSSGSQRIDSAQRVQAQQTSSMPNMSMPSMPSMPPMPPIPPIPPIDLGGMQMNINPMEMRMGNMSMGMGKTNSSPTANERRFCSQCGEPTKPSDRFCSNCGHKLTA